MRKQILDIFLNIGKQGVKQIEELEKDLQNTQKKIDAIKNCNITLTEFLTSMLNAEPNKNKMVNYEDLQVKFNQYNWALYNYFTREELQKEHKTFYDYLGYLVENTKERKKNITNITFKV